MGCLEWAKLLSVSIKVSEVWPGGGSWETLLERWFCIPGDANKGKWSVWAVGSKDFLKFLMLEMIGS